MDEDVTTWECFECNIKAINPFLLTDQWILRERTLLFDSNGEIWVRCYCMKTFHLRCCKNLPTDATEEQLDFEHYICDYCGWSMASFFTMLGSECESVCLFYIDKSEFENTIIDVPYNIQLIPRTMKLHQCITTNPGSLLV